VGNNFVGAVMNLMLTGNPWHKSQVVWVGDYYGDEDGEIGYYDIVSDSGNEISEIKSLSEQEQKRCFLINHTKKLYVDYSMLPEDEDGWIVNPLPLLTALGNGRGGGDYYEDRPDYDKVGIWAKDVLSVGFEIPDGFERFTVNFR